MAVSSETPLEKVWTLERERAVAWLRLTFAIFAIVVIQLNPSRVARFPLLSAISLGAFALYSLVALYITLKSKLGITTFGAIVTAFDIVWIAVIVFSTGGTRTPFFFYYSFPVITASLRWGLKGSIPVAFAAVSIYGVIRVTLAAEAMAEPLGIDTILIRSLYLTLLAGIFGYISEFEKKQNQKLLALSRTASQVATLQERRRTMFELHDGVLQSLATLILRIEGCRVYLSPSQPELTQELQSVEELARSTMKDIRGFLAGKSNAPMIPGTFVEKLRDELKFLQEGLGLNVVLDCEPENISLPQETENEVYYVLREALTNVTRHAHATRIEIDLRQAEDHLEGSLVDNGVGFEQNQKSDKDRFGLLSMGERIKQIGGELIVKSSPGAGTKISFVVPLAS
jgi:signal transduction histidine kinase